MMKSQIYFQEKIKACKFRNSLKFDKVAADMLRCLILDKCRLHVWHGNNICVCVLMHAVSEKKGVDSC